MARFSIPPSMVAKELKNRDAATRVAVQLGIFKAAHRARTSLVRRSRKLANDRGTYANAWQLDPSAPRAQAPRMIFKREVARVENKAPYAGIIELGARPHSVSAEGRASIREWVRRNIRVTTWSRPGRSGGQTATGERMRGKKDPELDRITQAIVWKIQRYGQRPRYVVSGLIGEFRKQVGEMVELEIRKLAGRRLQGGTT